MSTNEKSHSAQILDTLQELHKEELETVIQVLAKVTSLSPEAIKPHLNTMLAQLVKSKERPFYETATPEEWVKAFREWTDSHRRNTPLLSDYALSRAGIYEEDEEI